MTIKRISIAAFLVAASIQAGFAQRYPSFFAAQYAARAFSYGIEPGIPALTITPGGGTTTTGAGTITLNFGYEITTDGTQYSPINVNAPILVGVGSSSETVTPTAVSCQTPAIYGTCSITATFSFVHGQGDSVSSGTNGLVEAINFAAGKGGGIIEIDPLWTQRGGTSAMITAAPVFSSVSIADNRSGPLTFWGVEPTTLTSLAVPTTLAAGTVVFAAAPVGTWANSSYFFCVTYVDVMGGEGPCSATYNQTPTLNYSVTITSPAASTGAVGWRFYAGASYNAAYLMPIVAANCTLTTLESVIPACALGTNGVWLAPPLTTTTLRPNGQTPTVNLNLPMPQGHTTFAYQPISWPQPFQTNYGPFPAFGSLTSGQVAVVGSVNLPTGYLNLIGRTIRVTGKIALTTLNTATLPYITVGLGWAGGLTAGAPVSVCALVPAAAGSTATANQTFSCTITTNAVGATAVATAMTNGWELLSAAAGGALTGATVDTGTAAIGSLGFFSQNTLYVTYTSTTNATGGEQLLDLHVETIQ